MFKYVKKSEYKPLRDYVENTIKKVQTEFREKNILTFQFYRIGSAGKRHLITRAINGNKGFDFDYNFEIQKCNENYNNPKILKSLFIIINPTLFKEYSIHVKVNRYSSFLTLPT